MAARERALTGEPGLDQKNADPALDKKYDRRRYADYALKSNLDCPLRTPRPRVQGELAACLSGNSVRLVLCGKAGWGDPRNRTKALLPSYSDSSSYCLRFVDRFGDVIFNQLQIPFLISELRRQLEKIEDRATRNHGEAVLRLVESVEGKVHVYVRFIGD